MAHQLQKCQDKIDRLTSENKRLKKLCKELQKFVPPGYSGEAAARVFAVPELLERILLNCADLEDIEPPEVISPMGALYVWQRVNKTTKNIIGGSAKLRRLMFIDQLSKKNDVSLDYKNDTLPPLYWLLNKCAGSDKRNVLNLSSSRRSQRVDKFEKKGNDIIAILTAVSPRHYGTPEKVLRESLARQAATWRNIPLLRYKNFNENFAIFQHFKLDDVGWYKERFDIGPTSTLGEFYDWFEQGRMRDWRAHFLTFKTLLLKGENDGEQWELDKRWGSLSERNN